MYLFLFIAGLAACFALVAVGTVTSSSLALWVGIAIGLAALGAGLATVWNRPP